MQKLQVTGRVISVSSPKFIGEKSTPICTLRLDLTENPQYPNTPEFQAIGKSTNLVQGLKYGETVTLGIVIEGREYTNKDGEKGVITNLNILEVGRLVFTPITQDEPAQREPQPAGATKDEIF